MIIISELIGGMFEGDIMLAEDQKLDNASDDDAVVHNARKGKQWKEYGKGVVPYLITGSFTENQRKEIEKGMKAFHDKTCIRFKENNPKNFKRLAKHYLDIRNDKDQCTSYVGSEKSLPKQPVHLGNGCFNGHGGM